MDTLIIVLLVGVGTMITLIILSEKRTRRPFQRFEKYEALAAEVHLLWENQIWVVEGVHPRSDGNKVDLLLSRGGARDEVEGFDIAQIAPPASLIPVYFPQGPTLLKVDDAPNGMGYADNVKQLLARNEELVEQKDKLQHKLNRWVTEFDEDLRAAVAASRRSLEVKGGKVMRKKRDDD